MSDHMIIKDSYGETLGEMGPLGAWVKGFHGIPAVQAPIDLLSVVISAHGEGAIHTIILDNRFYFASTLRANALLTQLDLAREPA
jgi:hypothetical protein